jgi:hypothetical protein
MMCIERAIYVLAGSLALVGTVLAAVVSPWFMIVPGFVGANLLQSAFTGFCPAEKIFKKLGLPSKCGCGQ